VHFTHALVAGGFRGTADGDEVLPRCRQQVEVKMFESLFGSSMKTQMVAPEKALAGRDQPVLPVARPHTVLGTAITGP